MEAVTECFDLSDFYRVAEKPYSWPIIPEILNIDYQFKAVMKNDNK
jgi:hypothetical protein